MARCWLVRTTVLTVAAVCGAAAPAAAAGATIAGTTYEDLNRNQVHDAGEAALTNQQIYLFDGAGAYLAVAYSDAAGRYSFSGLTDGAYQVRYASPSWWALRADWVPTTTGTIHPRSTVHLSGSARADFGWRPIVRSTDLANPISAYVGPNGLRAESFNDAVTAREVYDRIMLGTVGAEAPHVVVRLDYSQSSSTTSSWHGAQGSYSNYQAICYDAYVRWLGSDDPGPSHEYGHAWSMYYASIVQQDASLASYLRARGLDGDTRVNSSYVWGAGEMIAEDYRQLLGDPAARASAQMNREIPPAADVPGLADFLASQFTQPKESSPPPPPAPSPALAVSSPTVTPVPVVKSATVTTSVTTPARITVTVATSTGDAVRTILSSTSDGGAVSASWDRKDAAGRRVKAGTYKVVVVAVDQSGASASATTPFQVA